MGRQLSFLPDGKERDSGHLLPWVIAVMVYLSALALIGSLGLHGAVASWTSDVTHNLTVQIANPDAALRQKQADAALAQLRAAPGVLKAEILDKSEIDKLLEPWLGQGNVTEDLPVPVMIDVMLDPGLDIDEAALALAVKKVAPDAQTDDHQQWIGQLVRLAGIIEITAVGIVLLIMLATVAIVMFGAKAGMASHQETIETLHIIGARDQTIAGAFQRRFLIYGLKGGLVGLVVAGVTVGFLIRVASDVGEKVMLSLTVSPTEIAAVAVLPIAAALISMLTARFTVLGALSRMV